MRQVVLILVCLMLSTSPHGREKDGAKGPPSLYNKWVFVCFQNVSTGTKDLPLDGKREVNIEFKSPNKIKGKGPCNYFEGEFKTGDKNRLTITSMTSTQMACHSSTMNIMEWESRYLNALRKADHYEIKDDELRIYFNDKTEVIIYKIKK